MTNFNITYMGDFLRYFDAKGNLLDVYGSSVVIDIEERLQQIENAVKNTVIVNSDSGEIASFTDGAENVPVKSLETTIEPIQDLHGQEYPWPAGSKNQLIFKTISGNIENNGKIVSGQDFHLLVAKVIAAQTYVYSADGVATQSGVMVLAFFSSEPEIGSVSYDGQRITTGQNPFVAPIDGYVAVRVASSNDVRRQIEAGSTATAYFPYSNICPISGRSEVNIWCEATYDTSADPAITTQLGQTVYGGILDVTTGVMTVDRAMVALDARGAISWNKSSSYPGGFYFDTDVFVNYYHVAPRKNTPFLCSHAKTVDNISDYVNGTCYCDGSINIRIMSADTTVEQWVNYLTAQNAAGTPVEMCCYLAQPVTVQLSAHQLTTLLGTNYVWSDSGNVFVEYVANTKLYIDGAIEEFKENKDKNVVEE